LCWSWVFTSSFNKSNLLGKMQVSERSIIWFNRILRWVLGGFFIAMGVLYASEGAWPIIIIGGVLIATSFLRPRRCIDDECGI